MWDRKNLKLLDNNDQLISQVPELDEDVSWNLASCCLSRGQMAVLSQTDGQEKLSLWDVSDPLKVTRSKSQYFKLGLPSDLEFPMKMDKHFIIEEYKPYEHLLQVDEHFIAVNNLAVTGK